MKKAYLLHGWGGKPEGAFRPWLARELETQGYMVDVPALPKTQTPTYETWIPFLHQHIQQTDADTVLVGHSLGGLAILHFLNELPEGQVIGKAVLVAPVVDSIIGLSESEKVLFTSWQGKALDTEKIKRSCQHLIGFFSDNDQWIPLESARRLKEQFGASIFIEHNMGHFSDDTGVKEVPMILEEILK